MFAESVAAALQVAVLPRAPRRPRRAPGLEPTRLVHQRGRARRLPPQVQQGAARAERPLPPQGLLRLPQLTPWARLRAATPDLFPDPRNSSHRLGSSLILSEEVGLRRARRRWSASASPVCRWLCAVQVVHRVLHLLWAPDAVLFVVSRECRYRVAGVRSDVAQATPRQCPSAERSIAPSPFCCEIQ